MDRSHVWCPRGEGEGQNKKRRASMAGEAPHHVNDRVWHWLLNLPLRPYLAPCRCCRCQFTPLHMPGVGLLILPGEPLCGRFTLPKTAEARLPRAIAKGGPRRNRNDPA